MGLDVGLDDEVADPPPQELLAGVAEELAGVQVGGHVPPGLVRDEDGHGRALDGLAEQADLHERGGYAQVRQL